MQRQIQFSVKAFAGGRELRTNAVELARALEILSFLNADEIRQLLAYLRNQEKKASKPSTQTQND